MKSIKQHWALSCRKSDVLYEVQDKVQIYNSRDDARYASYGVHFDNYKVVKINVTVKRSS